MHHSSSEEGMGVVERGERERVIICGYECAVKRLATGKVTAVYIIMMESFIMQAGESTNQICNFLCHSVTAITQTGNDNLLHLETSRKQV